MYYIINEQTLNKMISLLEDKPFKVVISLLNEIKAVPYNVDNQDVLIKETIDNKDNSNSKDE